MNGEVEMIWKEAFVAQSEYFSGICMEGPRKTTEDLSQDG